MRWCQSWVRCHPEAAPGPRAITGREGVLRSLPESGAPGAEAIVMKSALNIDGRALAEAVATQMASLYENSSVSPAANGVAYLDINGGFTAS